MMVGNSLANARISQGMYMYVHVGFTLHQNENSSCFENARQGYEWIFYQVLNLPRRVSLYSDLLYSSLQG